MNRKIERGIALSALHLVDGNGPMQEIVAKKVIAVSRTGIIDPAQSSFISGDSPSCGISIEHNGL